jgi:hypothetical protein
MEQAGSCARGFRQRPVWLAAVALLVVGQAGLTVSAFGGWSAITDDRPVTSGRHPLHLYHGSLGADTFRLRSSTTCYDPNFQAGYPKTPVFDAGCRPAELFLLVAGGSGRSDAAAYKLGLFACCLLAPVSFAAAARGAGISRAGAILAGAVGVGVWWSPPVRGLFDAGDVDILLAGLTAVVFTGWLARYHWEPGVTSWLVLAGTAYVGWYAHPVVWLGLSPVVLVFYLALAPRHGLAWHLGLFGVTLAAIGPNLWWLWDWGKFWWLRQPNVDDLAGFPTWGAMLGSASENVALLGKHPLGLPLVAFAGFGILWMPASRKRTAPAMFAASAALAIIVARLGQTWPPTIAGGAVRAAALVPALAVVPAIAVVSATLELTRLGRLLILFAAAFPCVLGWGGPSVGPILRAIRLDVSPVRLGLSPDQLAFARGLTTLTAPDGRILLEDGNPSQPGWNWTALLPSLTTRTFLGGLDPDATTEHAFCRLRTDRLNGRPLADWTDADLMAMCRRYNVGWVATRSPSATDRWRRLPQSQEVGRFADGGEIVLFRIDRPLSFVLSGSATWVRADRRKVVLTDVVPTDPTPDDPLAPRTVVLSLHHQAGLRISPGVVVAERDPDPHDPIPLLRLRMPGPMSRIVLTWENP